MGIDGDPSSCGGGLATNHVRAVLATGGADDHGPVA
jgi:hypothetical protein